MKAKLKKVGNNYDLYFINEDGNIETFSSTDSTFASKLSKQNCDEIFGVFDVDSWIKETLNDADVKDELMLKTSKMCLKSGFNKAMELNRFTLEDMRTAMTYGVVQEGTGFEGIHSVDDLFNLILRKVSQPTEIEVTFNPEEKDSEGCLILKKI
jgi:hypothetical protein